jgi:hypothetical protein
MDLVPRRFAPHPVLRAIFSALHTVEAPMGEEKKRSAFHGVTLRE